MANILSALAALGLQMIPQVMFVASQRPYLTYKEAQSMELGMFILPPHSALWKSSLLGLVRETLRSWKTESGCFSEG